jgi:cysteine synthase B
MDIVSLPEVGIADQPEIDLVTFVGHTPLLPLRHVTSHLPPRVRVYAKAEWFNPGGSVKDRPAFNIIRAALCEGSLLPGMHLLDSTSGNMGISYATLGAALDVEVTLVIPANASPERIAILKALGANSILSDPSEGSDGAIGYARHLAANHPEKYFYANQYDNPANWESHFQTSGPEIYQQTGGKVTHFVAGLGTTGTLTGVSRYLRGYIPHIQVIAVQPDSPFHGLEGLKHLESSIQPGIFDPNIVDQTVQIRTEDAYDMVRRLSREEGLFVGISSGGAAAAALQVAEGLEQGILVTIFPDAGYKYLSDKELLG